MSIDLARLCESMRDRLYSIGATAIGNPGVALAQALDAAATELRRQREEGAAAEPAVVMPPGEWTPERVKAYNEYARRDGYRAGMEDCARDFMEADAAPSPPPAEERERIAKEVRAAWWINCPGISTWSDLGPGHRDVYLRIADYVLQREAKLRKQVQHWTDDAARYASNADHWQRRFDKVEAERATLRAQVEQLTAEVAAMRPLVDAATEWCSKWDRNAAALGDAVHEYERARLKAQGVKP